MAKITFQEKNWQESFGNEYIKRNLLDVKEENKAYLNNYGFTRSALNKEFLGKLDHSIKILEVGTNIGLQLLILQKMGFKNLYGIETNRTAIEIAKAKTKNIDIIQASALDIPFKDNSFDMVFTAGVLIHISPKNIKKAMSEIHRCSKKYIWGSEYYAPKYTQILYHGKKNMLWKTDFAKLYTKLFKDLELLKEKRMKYLHNENIDTMFLLKKNGKN